MVREERCLDSKHAGFVVTFFKQSHVASKAIQFDLDMLDEGEYIFPILSDTLSTFIAQHVAAQGDLCAELGGCLDGAIEDQRPQSVADLHGING